MREGLLVEGGASAASAFLRADLVDRLLEAVRAGESRVLVVHDEAGVGKTALAEEFVVCDNWFSSMPGPTWPNRFYLMSGTSGGITTNGQWGYGIFDSGTIHDGTWMP